MRYYSTQRPIVPGSFPKPEGNTIEQIVNFPAKTYVDEIWKQAWGYIDYEKPLSEKVREGAGNETQKNPIPCFSRCDGAVRYRLRQPAPGGNNQHK